MSQASREREKQRIAAEAKAAAEPAKPPPQKTALARKSAKSREPLRQPFIVTAEMQSARKRLMAKIKAMKSQPGPKLLGVRTSKATGDTRLIFLGTKSMEDLHAKYDPELKDFMEAHRAQRGEP